MRPAPKYRARRVQPGILHITANYANGGVTRYACAIQLYGSAWARAKRKGQGAGSVLGYLRARAKDQRQAVVRTIINPPASYESRMNQELSVKPESKGSIMEIAVKAADLKKSLVAVCRSAVTGSTIPVLSHVKLEATSLGLRLTTTDLDVSRMELLPYADGMPSAVRWTSCVSAMVLKKLLPKSAADVKRAPLVAMAPSCFDGKAFESYAKYLTVCAAGIASLTTLPAEEFPMIPNMDKASEPVVWSGEAFRDLAGKVFPAISTKESRFQLSGARFELNGSARAIATDGHRLHCVDSELLVSSIDKVENDWAGLVPRELLRQALADYRFKPMGRGKKRYSNAVHMSWSEHHVWLETSGVRYCARLLEGTFPEYERLFKTGAPCRIETTGDDLVSTIAAVEHCTRDRARAIRLELDHDLPEFYAANPDKGEARATLNGSTQINGMLLEDDGSGRSERQSLGLNPDYVSDIGKVFRGALDISLWNENSHIVLTGPNFRSLIMPVRL